MHLLQWVRLAVRDKIEMHFAAKIQEMSCRSQAADTSSLIRWTHKAHPSSCLNTKHETHAGSLQFARACEGLLSGTATHQSQPELKWTISLSIFHTPTSAVNANAKSLEQIDKLVEEMDNDGQNSHNVDLRLNDVANPECGKGAACKARG